jgi:MSHA biogenesis protein MshP
MKGSKGERGFGLVAALFVVVVLAAAGTMMINTSGVQRSTTVLSLQGDRAYHAAASGIEWGIHRVLGLSACPGATTLSLTEGGLKGFDVDVSCTSSAHSEGGVSLKVYEITAIAEYGTYGDRDYVRRRMKGTVTDAP